MWDTLVRHVLGHLHLKHHRTMHFQGTLARYSCSVFFGNRLRNTLQLHETLRLPRKNTFPSNISNPNKISAIGKNTFRMYRACHYLRFITPARCDSNATEVSWCSQRGQCFSQCSQKSRGIGTGQEGGWFRGFKAEKHAVMRSVKIGVAWTQHASGLVGLFPWTWVGAVDHPPNNYC